MTAVMTPPATTVNPTQYSLVKDEFSRCVISPTFFDDFYREFTGKSPEIRTMFAHTDMKAQKEALRAGLMFLIMYAEGKSAIAMTKLDKLGASHRKAQLNVRPDLYPLWMQALISTVRKHVPTFNESSEAAWQAVLQLGVNRIVSHYND